MKWTTSFMLTGLLLLLVTEIKSQDLQIVQGDKTKTFKAGHLIRIDLPLNDQPNCKKCPKKYVVGRLISFKNDSIHLRLKIESESITEKEKEVGAKAKLYKDKMEEAWPIVSIPANDVLGITKQGKKNWRPLNDGEALGITYFSVGAIFLVSGLLAKDEENESTLLGGGITMSALGLAMVAIFERKTYRTENPLSVKGKGEPWEIK